MARLGHEDWHYFRIGGTCGGEPFGRRQELHLSKILAPLSFILRAIIRGRVGARAGAWHPC